MIRAASRDGSAGAGLDLIERHREAIAELGRRFGVARLEIFGSVCTSGFDPDASDVDILVTYPPGYDFGPWLARLQDLEAALTDLLRCKVDLVTASALRNEWFRREADKTRRVIYDASEVATVAH